MGPLLSFGTALTVVLLTIWWKGRERRAFHRQQRRIERKLMQRHRLAR